MATCMMESKAIPPKFWAEAINCASWRLTNILMESLLSKLGVDTILMCPTLGFFALKLGLEFHLKREMIWNPKFKNVYFFGYS